MNLWHFILCLTLLGDGQNGQTLNVLTSLKVETLVIFFFNMQETHLEISLDSYFLFNNLEPGQRSYPYDTYDIKVAL
jgi:hypothetical protein